MEKKWLENKELFCGELLNGYLWQLYVAEFLRLSGYDVRCPPLEYGGDKNRSQFANSRDITANGKIVEVKSRNYTFTSHLDFPFKTILIDTKSGFNAKADKPAMYVCVCQHNGSMCALDVNKTRAEWKEVRRYDKVRKISDTFLECDKDLWEDVSVASERLIGPSSALFRPTCVFYRMASWNSAS